jgi:hypothetical protein
MLNERDMLNSFVTERTMYGMATGCGAAAYLVAVAVGMLDRASWKQ